MEPQPQSTHQFITTEHYSEAMLLTQPPSSLLHKVVCSGHRPVVLWAWQEGFPSHSGHAESHEAVVLGVELNL